MAQCVLSHMTQLRPILPIFGGTAVMRHPCKELIPSKALFTLALNPKPSTSSPDPTTNYVCKSNVRKDIPDGVLATVVHL